MKSYTLIALIAVSLGLVLAYPSLESEVRPDSEEFLIENTLELDYRDDSGYGLSDIDSSAYDVTNPEKLPKLLKCLIDSAELIFVCLSEQTGKFINLLFVFLP